MNGVDLFSLHREAAGLCSFTVHGRSERKYLVIVISACVYTRLMAQKVYRESGSRAGSGPTQFARGILFSSGHRINAIQRLVPSETNKTRGTSVGEVGKANPSLP